MRRFPAFILILLVFPLVAGGCSKDSRRLNYERQRRIRAESWIRRAESALRSCQQHALRLQRQQRSWRNRCGSGTAARIAALQKQLAYVRSQMNARNRKIYAQSRQIQRLQQRLRTMTFRARGPGAVQVLAAKRYRGWVSAALRTQLMTLPPGVLGCYRSQLLPQPATQKGAFWVILATTRYGVRDADAGAKRMPTSRQRYFRRCVANHFRRLRTIKTRKPARFALLVAYAPRAAAIKTLTRPAFRWPWKPLSGGHHAGAGQICRLGSRALRGSGRLNPHLARPCAPGLKCCYPCGIPGCNSVCLKDCGPPRP